MHYLLVVVALLAAGCSKDRAPTGPSPSSNRPPTITAASISPSIGMEALTLFVFRGEAVDPDGDALTYRWTLGDNVPVDGQEWLTEFTSGGAGAATLTVRDGRGGEASRQTNEFVVRSMDGTWRAVQTPYAGWVFTLTLQQNGAFVAGTYGDNAVGAGKTDPSEPGRIDADGNFTLRLKVTGVRVSDFYMRGNLDASGLRASGGLYNSGFNGQPFVMDKIAF